MRLAAKAFRRSRGAPGIRHRGNAKRCACGVCGACAEGERRGSENDFVCGGTSRRSSGWRSWIRPSRSGFPKPRKMRLLRVTQAAFGKLQQKGVIAAPRNSVIQPNEEFPFQRKERRASPAPRSSQPPTARCKMADRVRYNMDRLAGTFRQMEEADLFTKVSRRHGQQQTECRAHARLV